MLDDDKDRDVVDSSSFLVRIKDKILLSLNIPFRVLKSLVDRYVESKSSETPFTKNFEKVNLLNSFNKNKMTIKVFFKFLKVILAEEVEFVITIKTKTGKSITVREQVRLEDWGWKILKKQKLMLVA